MNDGERSPQPRRKTVTASNRGTARRFCRRGPPSSWCASLPLAAGPAADAAVGPVMHRALAPRRIDAQLEPHVLGVEHAEGVAYAVRLPRSRGVLTADAASVVTTDGRRDGTRAQPGCRDARRAGERFPPLQPTGRPVDVPFLKAVAAAGLAVGRLAVAHGSGSRCGAKSRRRRNAPCAAACKSTGDAPVCGFRFGVPRGGGPQATRRHVQADAAAVQQGHGNGVPGARSAA